MGMSQKKIDGFSNLNYKSFDQANQMSSDQRDSASGGGGAASGGGGAASGGGGAASGGGGSTSLIIPYPLHALLMAMISSLTRDNISERAKKVANRTFMSFQYGPSPRDLSSNPIDAGTPLATEIDLSINFGAIPLESTKSGEKVFVFGGLWNTPDEEVLPGCSSTILIDPLKPILAVDQFSRSTSMIDSFREAVRRQQCNYIESKQLFRSFGDVSFLWSLRKYQFKLVLWVLSMIVGNDFVGSAEVHELMSTMYRWLLLQRMIEYIYSIIRNSVQLPQTFTDKAVISERVLVILKQFLEKVVPKHYTDLKTFVHHFTKKLNDLEAIFNHLQMVMTFDKSISRSHMHEMRKLLRDLEKGGTPSCFVHTNRPYEIPEKVPADLRQILSEQQLEPDKEVLSAITGLLRKETVVFRFDWLDSSEDLMKKILEIRTASLKKQTEVLLAQTEKLRAERIKVEAEMLLERAKRKLWDEMKKRDIHRDSHCDSRKRSRSPRDSHRDPRDSHRDPRDFQRDPRDSRCDSRDSRCDSRDSHRDPRDSRCDPRDSHRDPRDSRRDSRESNDRQFGYVSRYVPRDEPRRRSRSPRRN